MRKTKRLLLWLSAALVLLTACASKTEAPAVMLAKAASSENNAKSITKSSAVPKLYTNNKLSFSFTVPDSWETGNYTVVTADETMPGDGTKYTKADFLFQDDKNSPLLTILLVPDDWWKKTKGEALESKPVYLGEKGNIVYCFTLPKDCPYDVGTKADLYNSMVLPDSDVPNRFKILSDNSSPSAISTVEGVLEEVMTQTITLKTDDGRSLTFLKEGADTVNAGNGLQIGHRVKIYYTGSQNGTDTKSVTVTKIEQLN